MEDSLSISNRCLVLNIKFHGQSILYVKKKKSKAEHLFIEDTL